jgi:hypothetical protein
LGAGIGREAGGGEARIGDGREAGRHWHLRQTGWSQQSVNKSITGSRERRAEKHAEKHGEKRGENRAENQATVRPVFIFAATSTEIRQPIAR